MSEIWTKLGKRKRKYARSRQGFYTKKLIELDLSYRNVEGYEIYAYRRKIKPDR